MHKNSINPENSFTIKESIESDRPEIENIHARAFGRTKGDKIAELVKGLFNDKTALPLFSLVAVEDKKIIGHILYTRAKIIQAPEPVSARILAPLAILPAFQGKAIGTRLIEQSLNILKESGVKLVFVLGHPKYYPRAGFKPAEALGFKAPYPIPEEHAGAWMVQELSSAIIGKIKGTVQCCDALDQPEHWRE